MKQPDYSQGDRSSRSTRSNPHNGEDGLGQGRDSLNSDEQLGRDKGEFSAAMSRLEGAVAELVNVTTGQLSDRATNLIDDTSKRLEAELRLRRAEQKDPEIERNRDRRQRRHRHRHEFNDRSERMRRRTAKLYRDPEYEKIAGVCAGLGRYFGIETWKVRMGALTGLIFLPGIVFPAYWVAYFIMDEPDEKSGSTATPSPEDVDQSEKRHSKKSSLLSSRRERRAKRRQARQPTGKLRGMNNSPDEQETLQPAVALRHTVTDLTQAELRLRRLESFVTSDQYELQKELTKIEKEHARTAADSSTSGSVR